MYGWLKVLRGQEVEVLVFGWRPCIRILLQLVSKLADTNMKTDNTHMLWLEEICVSSMNPLRQRCVHLGWSPSFERLLCDFDKDMLFGLWLRPPGTNVSKDRLCQC